MAKPVSFSRLKWRAEWRRETDGHYEEGASEWTDEPTARALVEAKRLDWTLDVWLVGKVLWVTE